eukprot:CAMPEP_0115852820 /NCGR_PEP_ID=MMETSP0287-20121206/13190_1 /TAXON_ID=412157 /ORGANISM="Chrysochromulina rotalis, Strain UIO044" /LENGTH=210 /DNA_ID=CAMNT_0003306887 /DNA_START=61 /DNA_END=693 /DNA_ORIENTATION=+
MQGRTDYSEEGRKLIARLKEAGAIGRPGGYNPMDLIYADPTTGGKIFVGNQTAARAADQHPEKITHVVNCTDDMPNYCERNPAMNYLKFNVSYWQSGGTSRGFERRPDGDIIKWLDDSVFSFVNGALSKGENVLVHCLAGAHRAGTTGVLLLMHKTGMGAEEATRAAKELRSAINPICDFPKLLALYEENRHLSTWSVPPAGHGAATPPP